MTTKIAARKAAAIEPLRIDVPQSQLDDLRNHLAQDTPLTDEERASLQAIANAIEIRLASQAEGVSNDSLVDGVNLAVERFEVSHPSTAMTLRNIMQTLANMGI